MVRGSICELGLALAAVVSVVSACEGRSLSFVNDANGRAGAPIGGSDRQQGGEGGELGAGASSGSDAGPQGGSSSTAGRDGGSGDSSAGGAAAGDGGAAGCFADEDCPGGGSGAPGASGESFGGRAGEDGAGAGGEVDMRPVDDAIGVACKDFCGAWIAACGAAGAASSARCHADCVNGYRGMLPACSRIIAEFLGCSGAPDDCSQERNETPERCRAQEAAVVACAYGAPPAGCEAQSVSTGFSGCERTLECGKVVYQTRCDAEEGGSGASLCDCYANGDYSGTRAVRGIGIMACLGAASVCATR